MPILSKATWKKDVDNPSSTSFEVYQQDQPKSHYRRTVNQMLEPYKHVYGSLGHKESYQSIGRFTAEKSSVKITATKIDKGTGIVPVQQYD